ncbi:MAG: alanine racemase [Parvibaculales bacterium]
MSEYHAKAAPHDHACLRVDLSALAANYLHYKALSDTAETAAVVKADAYGVGLSKAAPALHEAGCRSFFVAQAGEGARLRETLKSEKREAVIYVMNGYLEGAWAFYQTHHLRPCLNSLAEVQLWVSAGGGAAALHVDTGFNRLGLPQADINNLPDDFTPALLMSHLACADTPDHPMNKKQLADFEEKKKYFKDVPASLSNSGGALLGSAFHQDLIRVGIGLYGGSATLDAISANRPVVTLLAPVLQTRTVRSGETIGYGATFTAEKDMQVAILAIGYADGFPRLLSRHDNDAHFARVAFGDRLCPLVGRVSMDLLAVDISELDTSLQPGDMAEIFGPRIPVDAVAQQAGTISYEILTQLGSRYKRVYDTD